MLCSWLHVTETNSILPNQKKILRLVLVGLPNTFDNLRWPTTSLSFTEGKHIRSISEEGRPTFLWNLLPKDFSGNGDLETHQSCKSVWQESLCRKQRTRSLHRFLSLTFKILQSRLSCIGCTQIPRPSNPDPEVSKRKLFRLLFQKFVLQIWLNVSGQPCIHCLLFPCFELETAKRLQCPDGLPAGLLQVRVPASLLDGGTFELCVWQVAFSVLFKYCSPKNSALVSLRANRFSEFLKDFRPKTIGWSSRLCTVTSSGWYAWPVRTFYLCLISFSLYMLW